MLQKIIYKRMIKIHMLKLRLHVISAIFLSIVSYSQGQNTLTVNAQVTAKYDDNPNLNSPNQFPGYNVILVIKNIGKTAVEFDRIIAKFGSISRPENSFVCLSYGEEKEKGNPVNLIAFLPSTNENTLQEELAKKPQIYSKIFPGEIQKWEVDAPSEYISLYYYGTLGSYLLVGLEMKQNRVKTFFTKLPPIDKLPDNYAVQAGSAPKTLKLQEVKDSYLPSLDKVFSPAHQDLLKRTVAELSEKTDLEQLFTKGEYGQRKVAIQRMQNSRDPKYVKPLISGLLKEEPGSMQDLSIEIREALISIGEPAVIPLLDLLKHQNFYIRQHAVVALGEIGDTRAYSALSKLSTDDPEKVIRNLADYALKKIKK
jgi:hypothetical protein